MSRVSTFWVIHFDPDARKIDGGKYFINFSPAMRATAGKAIRQEVRRWKLRLCSDKSLSSGENKEPKLPIY